MPLYMFRVGYTPDSWAAQIQKPANREEALKPAVRALGGRILSFYYAFGEDDVVLIAQMPDNKAAAALALAAAFQWRAFAHHDHATHDSRGGHVLDAAGKANPLHPARRLARTSSARRLRPGQEARRRLDQRLDQPVRRQADEVDAGVRRRVVAAQRRRRAFLLDPRVRRRARRAPATFSRPRAASAPTSAQHAPEVAPHRQAEVGRVAAAARRRS